MSLTSAAVVVAASFGLRRARTRKETTQILAAMMPSFVQKAPLERKSLLLPVASRIASTHVGGALLRYAEKTHPGAAFSDVVAATAASIIAGGIVGQLLFGPGPLLLVTAASSPLILDRIVQKAGGRRTARLEQQLPEALAIQAGSLRGGNSTISSLRMIAREVPAPLGSEISETVREIDIGRPLERALSDLASRTSSKDVQLWVTAMTVHRLTGGNLSNMVESLAGRVRERIHLRGELRALTAQGRLSGAVVGLAPIAFFILLSITSRDQMRVLYSTPLGWLLLTAGLLMELIGFMWIRWILRIRP